VNEFVWLYNVPKTEHVIPEWSYYYGGDQPSDDEDDHYVPPPSVNKTKKNTKEKTSSSYFASNRFAILANGRANKHKTTAAKRK
jgi:hypothetical protein